MATGYTEEAAGGSAPPSAYRNKWDDQFATLFDLMCHCLRQGYAITDLRGLECLGQLLYQIDMYRTLTKKEESKMSLAFTEQKLLETEKLLKNFQPMLQETSEDHAQFCQRMNFKRCYEVFFTYIADVSSSISSRAQDVSRVRTSLLSTTQVNAKVANCIVHLQQIKFDVEQLKTRVEEKFNSYPLVECDVNSVHWVTRTHYAQETYLPYAVQSILLQFPYTLYEPMPPWLLPKNAPIVEKVCNKTKIELKARTPDHECAVCKVYVAFLIDISVLQDCDHLFCFGCWKNWIIGKPNEPWMCPICKVSVDCYGSIEGVSNDSSVTVQVPPHRQIVTVEFCRSLLKK